MLGFHNVHWINSTLEIYYIFIWIFCCCCSDFTWTPFPQGTFLPRRLYTFCSWLLSVLWFFALHNTASCFRIWNLTYSLLFSKQFLGGRSFFGAAGPFTNCWSDCEQLTDKRCVRCRLDWQATGCAGFLGLLRDTHLLTVSFRSLWTSEASQWVFTRRTGESRGVTENPSPLLSHLLHSSGTHPNLPKHWSCHRHAGHIKSLMNRLWRGC